MLAGIFVIVVVVSVGLAVHTYQKQKETEKRIQPLIAAGLSQEDALAFDLQYSSLAPYDNNEVNYAKNLWLPYVKTNMIRENDALYILHRYPQLLATPDVLAGDYDHDNVTNENELFGPNSDILNPVVANHTTAYALSKGLPKDIVKQIQVLGEDLDNEKRAFIDKVSSLDENMQKQFCPSGDIDGDNLSNYFEWLNREEIGGLYDPFVKNDRYVIFIEDYSYNEMLRLN
jgi:hypothetical protein